VRIKVGFAYWPILCRTAILMVGLGIGFHGTIAHAQQSNDVFFRKGGWTGIVLRREGRTFGCAVEGTVGTKLRLYIVHAAPAGKWKIVLDRPSELGKAPGFARDRQWKMDLLVDGVQVHSGTAIVDHTGMAVLEPELKPAVLKALSRGVPQHRLGFRRRRGKWRCSEFQI